MFDLQNIVTRIPIDKTAALVTGKGVHFYFRQGLQSTDRVMPYKMKQIENCIADSRDLSGKRQGRLTVIGMLDSVKIRWVVKCDCGKYSTRTSKAIKNKKNSHDCCDECYSVAYLKKRDYFLSTGKHVQVEEFL